MHSNPGIWIFNSGSDVKLRVMSDKMRREKHYSSYFLAQIIVISINIELKESTSFQLCGTQHLLGARRPYFSSYKLVLVEIFSLQIHFSSIVPSDLFATLYQQSCRSL